MSEEQWLCVQYVQDVLLGEKVSPAGEALALVTA